MFAYANVYFKTICECIRQSIFIGPTSIAEVPFDSVRRFRATLLLRTTCMRLWDNWVASCVAALQTKNQRTGSDRPHALRWHGGWERHTTFPCQGVEGGTSASTCFWILPTPLLSESFADTLEGVCITWVWKTKLGALDKPSWHNHPRTTSWPRSYILHSTLQSPHDTAIPTQLHH